MTRLLPVIVVVLAACTDDTIRVSPILDVPTNDDASAFPVDSFTISVAHEGAEVDLVSATFSANEPIELANIPFGDDLVIHMTGRVGTSEKAYGRTCRFAVRADGAPPEPRLYLARLVTFGGMALRPLARTGGVALTFNDGSGLLLGGVNPNDPDDSIEQVERYDPNTGEYETLHDLVPRIGSAIATLGEGRESRVIVVGGVVPTTGQGAEFVEVLDADIATDLQYEMFPEPQMALVGLTATTLSDGRVIVIGGRTPNGLASNRVVEIGTTSGIVSVSGLGQAQLATARYGHTATRLADVVGAGVLVIGGLDDAGVPVAAAELFKPLSEAFSPMFARNMVVPRSRHTAVPLPDGSVLVVGGVRDVGGTPTPVGEIELFTLDAGFSVVGELPPTAGRINLSATVLPDGRVLLAGGQLEVGGTATSNTYIARLDPLDGTIDILPTDRLGEPRAGHQATLLCDGTVLMSGGTSTLSTYERYNPPAIGRR